MAYPKRSRTRRSKSPSSKLVTLAQVKQGFARKRQERFPLFNDGCLRTSLCPQKCDDNGFPSVPTLVQLISNTNLRAAFQDAIRVTNLRWVIHFTPWVFASGTALELIAVRDASYVLRAQMCKQQVQETAGVTTGALFVNPLDPFNWTDVPTIKRWEYYHASEFLRTGGNITSDTEDIPAFDVPYDGFAESCCPDVEQASWTIIAGEAVVPPLTTVCGACTGSAPDGQPATGGTLHFPAQTSIFGGMTTTTIRPLPTHVMRFSRRAPLVLKDDDELNLWVNWSGLGIQQNEACFPPQDLEGVAVGFFTWGYGTCTVEY